MENPTITNTSELKIETYYVDGDTRTITLKNPADNITSEQISNLNAMIQKDNLLIGDRTGATFGKITRAARVRKTTVNYGSGTITPE